MSTQHTTADLGRLTVAILVLFIFGVFAMADANLHSSRFILTMKIIAIFPYLLFLKKLFDMNEHVYEDRDDTRDPESAFFCHFVSFWITMLTVCIIVLCFGWVSGKPSIEALSKIFLVFGLVLNLKMSMSKKVTKKASS